jgi:hypothetical protein
MILTAAHLAVEIACAAFLAAALLFAAAALIEHGARADRALADVDTARSLEVPDGLGAEMSDWERDSWLALRRDWERDQIEREPYDWSETGL